ncbi:GNAT family N-acetyltransferase [Bosea sp. (in: a-proteobacteria)]|uniref:GNAT family N-acetyltransferase n=1 Tax=Bosea sp. (in: a-proteobacteria) TaxID=1871050 RepID=UPI002606020F|nr:GNAT family N-acetyltransferase [Bosea sp. (in: a-proteobacteria)]MCO5090121.1 GNAT family N-acetyltransferase [Bosea sp. (in: a-proteobacteria)]
MPTKTGDDALVLGCERRIVNAWPALSTLVVGDWVLRFANGYSGRANSATPLNPGAELDAEMLDLIEELYRADGLAPCIRLTPLVAQATRAAVLARGYRVKDRSFGQIAPVSGFAVCETPEWQIDARPSPEWCAGVAALQSGAKTHAGNLAAIVEKIRLPAAFASWLVEGEPVAFGLSVAERGMAEIGLICVHPDHRGHGHGRSIVAGLMGWAGAMGCRDAYLQVETGNAVALALYAGLGFRSLYEYETRVLD